MGINKLILEVNFGFQFTSHPELIGDQPLSLEQAQSLTQFCQDCGIEIIPQFNCLGHQSWDKHTFPLLTRYPDFDETPGQFPGNKGIYCRSWCPRHPEVNHVVFALIDEIAEAFQAKRLHIGMDEVFLIASPHCPRCRDAVPAEIYAEALNTYHEYFHKKCGMELLIWGDRLLDADEFDYWKYEAAENGTAPAIDMISKDLIICDWHYTARASYPSVGYFQEKGFRVLPATWKGPLADKNFLRYARENDQGRVLGHLCTTWVNGEDVCRALLGEARLFREEFGAFRVARSVNYCMNALRDSR